MAEKRIIEQTASNEVYDDDWIAKDSPTQGTTKIQPSSLKEYFNDGQASSADLTALSDDISLGADGTVYPSAGDAVRGQVGDINTTLTNNINDRLTLLDGCVVPNMELGNIAFSSSAISYQSSNTAIRTPQNSAVRVEKGDIISLADYSNKLYKLAILKDSDNKYTYTSFGTDDYTVNQNGLLYIVVKYSDDSQITHITDLSSLIRIKKNNCVVNTINSNITALQNYKEIIENNHMTTTYFGNGDFNQGYVPTSRRYRVSTKELLTFDYNVHLKADTGFRFYPYYYINGEWDPKGWQTEIDIDANTTFGMVIARTTEDTSEVANVNTFVSSIVATSNLSSSIVEIKEMAKDKADKTAISEYMAKFYNGDSIEAYTFFTDPHLMGENGTFSIDTFNSYIKTLEDTVNQNGALYVVCGGDWLNRGDTKSEASTKLGFVDGRMRNAFPNNYFPMVGNHDFNYLGVDENGVRLTEQNWIQNNSMANFWFKEYKSCYYKFKKHIAQNYVLNTRTDYDGTNAYDKEMLDWLADNLIQDNAPHNTIMFHIYYLSSVGTTIPKRVKAIGKIIEAFNSHAICTLTEETEGYSKTYDFSNTTGHIDYTLVGHSHADFVDTFGGVPVIGSVNFQKEGVPSFDLVYVDYTNNKLYLTRVGTGASREINI